MKLIIKFDKFRFEILQKIIYPGYKLWNIAIGILQKIKLPDHFIYSLKIYVKPDNLTYINYIIYNVFLTEIIII